MLFNCETRVNLHWGTYTSGTLIPDTTESVFVFIKRDIFTTFNVITSEDIKS